MCMASPHKHHHQFSFELYRILIHQVESLLFAHDMSRHKHLQAHLHSHAHTHTHTHIHEMTVSHYVFDAVILNL